MSDLVNVILKSGIVDDENLSELRRWGLPLPQRAESEEYQSDVGMTNEGLCQAIDRALQDQGYVITRETDLDLFMQYVRKNEPATLFLCDEDTQEPAGIELRALRTSAGEYVLPWEGDEIDDLLTNGLTYLRNAEGKTIYFQEAREVFYGDNKAFVVCVPSKAGS